jgi:hypothetical protein
MIAEQQQSQIIARNGRVFTKFDQLMMLLQIKPKL